MIQYPDSLAEPINRMEVQSTPSLRLPNLVSSGPSSSTVGASHPADSNSSISLPFQPMLPTGTYEPPNRSERITSRFPCSRQLVLDRSDRVFIIWSKRIRTFACRYQKPMPYHLAILHTALFWTVERGEGEGRSRARRTSRAVQERGVISSKQQGYPFRLGPTTTSSRL